MPKKYVLTGGPGTGKSALLLELERRGEYVVREAAIDVIFLSQAKGIMEPWRDIDAFQDEIVRLQLHRERNLPSDLGRVFLDRGIPDGLAYFKLKNVPPTTFVFGRSGVLDYESSAFFLEPLGIYNQTKTRRESQSEAEELGNLLIKVYEHIGFDIVKIPPLSVEERANLILSRINQ